MANTKTPLIIDNKDFLTMPISAQCLYLHFSARAQEDGFVKNPKKIQQAIKVTDNDVSLLFKKKYIIPNDEGIVVIKNSKIHKYISDNDFGEAPCELKEKKKDSIPYQKILDLYNTTCKSLPACKRITDIRQSHIKKRFTEGYTFDDFKTVFEKAEASSFLKGEKGDWSANFDWLILPTNIAKVLDGNYDNKTPKNKSSEQYSHEASIYLDKMGK